jgi:hypothetical protein
MLREDGALTDRGEVTHFGLGDHERDVDGATNSGHFKRSSGRSTAVRPTTIE